MDHVIEGHLPDCRWVGAVVRSGGVEEPAMPQHHLQTARKGSVLEKKGSVLEQESLLCLAVLRPPPTR